MNKKRLSLNINFISYFFLVFLVFLSLEIYAQDSIPQGPTYGTISMPNPSSIVSKYEYDSYIDKYIYTEKIGSVNTKFPLVLTPKEFEALVLEEQMKSYFKQKSDAALGKGDVEDQKNLIPIFYVNNSFFQSVFGGNQIEVNPRGSVAVDMGILYSKQDNPALSPRNQSNLTFDFDQRISMSLQASVGTRLQVNAEYDTESTFDFQNQVKMDYTPTEDDIIQKIEVGNVNMPLNSTLIQGSQSLFGVKTQLQFGKTTITGVFSELNSERQSVNIQGGATVREFDKFALDYDENRHFFLSQFFRDQYDEALQNYPFINSRIQITRVQVWITNRTNNTETISDSRNIVALQDLGESAPDKLGLFFDNNGNPIAPPIPNFLLNPNGRPDNANNVFNPDGINGGANSILNDQIRDIATIQQGFGSAQPFVSEGRDYAILENARELGPNEFFLNTQLGYISLNQRLNNDEILGVAFEYTTTDGRVFRVGEFANGGPPGTETQENPEEQGEQIALNQNLIVKLLKSPVTIVQEPIWDLMMKNFYSLGANGLEQDGFRFNILYTDPQPVNFITQAPGSTTPLPDDVDETNLLQVLDLDRLNLNNDPVNGGDGFFDFVSGITIDPENGVIKFTKVEPFGEYLFNKLDLTPETGPENYDNPETYNQNQTKYVFNSLYSTTKTQAQQDGAQQNKFQLAGRYKASSTGGIPIGAFNVPRGSVSVTAGGRTLQEGIDYTVNYELGRVNILDEALLASDTPIQVSTENNALFGRQTKRFTGIDVQHRFSEELLIGGTYLNLNERPITQKADYGTEPINNSIYGVNFNYNTTVPFFTRLVNKLPNIDTDVESNFSLRGEFAYLRPGTPEASDFEGEATSYVDDFEGSQTSISVIDPLSWKLASTPIGYRGPNDANGTFDSNDDLSINDYRAKLNWHTIDPIFYSSQRPEDVTDQDLSQYYSRRVLVNEIFPNVDIVPGQIQTLFPLDLVYRPSERGMYNYNPAASNDNILPNPKQNFGGIMRGLQTTDFEQSNVEFVEFWVMDPFIYAENAGNNGGKVVLNFGSITEDISKDGRKQFENGLPEDGGNSNTLLTNFSKVPSNQSLVYAFDTEGQERINQDVGYDGLLNSDEALKFPAFANFEDPSNDDYQYYLDGDGDLLNRYRNFNGMEGNSPVEVTENNRGNSAFPDVEDINLDNTMNTIDSYYEYEVPVFPNMSVENNTSTVAGINSDYITDVKEVITTLQNGQEIEARWIQFRVPLRTGEEFAVGGISDLRSIRFMRMFMTGFSQETILRFGTLELIRGDYFTYDLPILPNGQNPMAGNTQFNVEAVSEEITSNYVTPPGVLREELVNNNVAIREDEKSLSLRVKNLETEDSRAVFKNYQIDMRQYDNLEMYLHAEALPPPENQLQDGQLTAFVRMGIDFTNNYYQIEIPLKVTDPQDFSPRGIWPLENDLNLPLDLLQQIKSTVLGDDNLSNLKLNYFDESLNPVDGSSNEGLKVGIIGNPSFGNIRVMMLGLKNSSNQNVSGEVWFNEMRLTGLKNEGGWAAVLNLDTNFADFANVSASGRRTTVGFGAIEQGPNQRSREDIQQYDIVTGLNLGQLLPKDWGVKIPLTYNRGEELITPQFDPVYGDLELETLLDNTADEADRAEFAEQAETYTKRQGISVIGLRKDRTNQEKTPMPYDIENFTVSSSYNQTDYRDFEIRESLDQNVDAALTYGFNFKPLEVKPLENIGLFKSPYFAIFKDFNINLLPNSITAGANINRQYNELRFREFDLPTGSIGTPKLFQRNYFFDWQYAIDYNLTKSLNFNFNASTNRIVRNYIDENNVQDNSIGIFDDFFDIGIPNRHYQQLQLNYTLPFNKIPFLKFVQTQYSYTGDFLWTKGSEILRDLEGIPDLGNSVQNSARHQINSNLNMSSFYNYLGLTKKRAQNPSQIKRNISRRRGAENFEQDPQNQNNQENAKTELTIGDKALNTIIGLVTVLDRVQFNYSDTKGIFLPGYTNNIGFGGTLKPTAGFTFGSQNDIRREAARKGWLTMYQDFNEQYIRTDNQLLDIQAGLKLLPGMTIDLIANRMYSDTYTENFRVDPETMAYNSIIPNTYGNFNISTNMIRTSFNSSTKEFSENFETFRENRFIVANRLAEQAGVNVNDPNNIDEDGYPIGFGRTSQAVLLPSFLSAYTGSDPQGEDLSPFRDIPIPGWNIKYTGLMRLTWFRETFNRFSIQHGYRSSYTVNQFQTDLEFNRSDPFGDFNTDQNGNFRTELFISNVNLIEEFSPLIKLDFEMKNSVSILAEVRKDRALSLSFNNNLLTEMQGDEYIIGLGYRVKDLTVVTQFEGNRRVLSSDLNLKADLSLRRNETIIRNLDVLSNRVTSGQDIWSINFVADYAFTKNLTALFFYDHVFSQNAISTIFPQTTVRTGFTLRYNFGN
ncbi:T9SS outer membrane translocon Sov/SprA [Psychroflexus sp. MES1-P1E]|uniref:T9SS outer membrane translocon Sov/SprA n=1 Tax=Psychroflexus sp. MES1-P1E TaxID=2058320 RepID=UPI000C7D8223|nr:cell surface protein SprA [Psychroflexus sp. MES1-P1E]PKG41219.1 cell surface protein SprA [Psychroflexus sp. MES1-P1E]